MQEKLDDLIQRNEAILVAKETEERELTEDEVTAIEATEKEIELIERQIALEKRHESRKRESVKTEETKVQEKFSLVKAVRIAGGFAKMEGLEAEMHQEAVREARENGQEIQGIGIPHMIINPESERTYVTTTTTGAGDLVKETYRGINEGLLPKLMIGQLGGRVTSNKGEIVTIKTNYNTAVWETEVAAADEKKLTFTKATYKPERLGAYTPVSRKMLIQDGYGLEGRMVNDLMNAMKIALDAAAINGSGNDEPKGILNWTGKTTVAMGDNGLAPTRAKLLEMEKGIDTSLASLSGLKWLTTPGIKEYLRNLNVDSGSGLFVWGENGNVLGYPAYTSTQVPSNLVKGGSGAACHAIILGDFSKVEMAQFGGYDIIVDPYSSASTNVVNVWANSYWNVIIDYPESFAVIVDALTS
jgi:HK97 family phage major capsid protein